MEDENRVKFYFDVLAKYLMEKSSAIADKMLKDFIDVHASDFQ